MNWIISPPCRHCSSQYDWVFIVLASLYVLINALTICIAGLAALWYFQSLRPVVDWVDPDGPGFRVVAVTPETVTVRWLQLRLKLSCPGHTEVAILGQHWASHIESYPFLIDALPQTFNRYYALPKGLPAGAYQLRVTDIATCNPLFENRQILRVPFELPATTPTP